MSLEEHYRKLEKMYLSAPTNEFYKGLAITIGNKQATITVPVHDKMYHAAKAVHGAHYFKLLDDSAYFAANSTVTDVFVLTSTFNINLVRPIVGGELRAEGKVHFRSKNLIIAESELFNEKGRMVASGTGHFMRSQIELSEDIGYRLD